MVDRCGAPHDFPVKVLRTQRKTCWCLYVESANACNVFVVVGDVKRAL
jgi:hypothetical protein